MVLKSVGKELFWVSFVLLERFWDVKRDEG